MFRFIAGDLIVELASLIVVSLFVETPLCLGLVVSSCNVMAAFSFALRTIRSRSGSGVFLLVVEEVVFDSSISYIVSVCLLVIGLQYRKSI